MKRGRESSSDPMVVEGGNGQWMRSKLTDAQRTTCGIRQLCMPGTHDSGTYAITSDSSVAPDCADAIGFLVNNGRVATGSLVSNWAKTQNLSLYEQLACGARYVDWRLAMDANGKFRACHSLFGALLSDMVDQLDKFILATDGSEVVVVDVQRLFQMRDDDDYMALHATLMAGMAYTSRALQPGTDTVDTPLSELEKRGRCVMWVIPGQYVDKMVLLADKTKMKSPWYAREQMLVSNWLDAQTLKEWKDRADGGDEEVQKRKDADEAKKLYVMQAVLTPGTKEILASVLTSSTLMTGVNRVNAVAKSVFAKHRTGLGGICMVDFIEYGGLVDAVVACNGRQ